MSTPFPRNRLWLSNGLNEPAFDDTGRSIFYVRSSDGKRSLIRQDLASGLAEVITAEPTPSGNVGYGGGTYAVRGSTLVYASGGRLIGVDLDTGAQRTLTPTYEGLAAPTISPCGRFAAFVIELEGHAEVLLTDTLGADLPVKLTSAPDFAANPTFSSDGARLAWIEWNVGSMPWEESRIQIAQFAHEAWAAAAPTALLPLTLTTLAKPGVAYTNPQWSPDGTQFAYTSDESGWRSLYLASGDGQDGVGVDTGQGEIGLPDWAQGQFAVRWGTGGRSIYAVRRYRSHAHLLRVALPEQKVEVLPSIYTAFGDIAVHPSEPELLLYSASASTIQPALVTRSGDEEIVRASTAIGRLDPDALVQAEVIEWPTVDGTPIYGIFYRAATGDGPRPTLVMIHGGPTGESANRFEPEAQYYASKGWHCLQVNHRGGSGSGRAYQDLLEGAWGVVDIEDARSGAQHLIDQGLADPARLAITGGSAGGFTTLMALGRDPDFWAAGVSLFGLGNLYEVRVGSHRFEARYEDTIVGPLPETAARWIERSPLTYASDVRAPVQLFHGKEDRAVPYQQSVEFADAVKAKGGIVELVLYDDEGHGFRREANRRDQAEKMERFLEKYVIYLQGRKP